MQLADLGRGPLPNTSTNTPCGRAPSSFLRASLKVTASGREVPSFLYSFLPISRPEVK